MESDQARTNAPTRVVLQGLLGHQRTGVYSLTLGAETRLGAGSLHPILARLERLGWVESWWQDVPGAEADLKQPVAARRRYYRLTAAGADLVRRTVSPAGQGERSWVEPWRPIAAAA